MHSTWLVVQMAPLLSICQELLTTAGCWHAALCCRQSDAAGMPGLSDMRSRSSPIPVFIGSVCTCTCVLQCGGCTFCQKQLALNAAACVPRSYTCMHMGKMVAVVAWQHGSVVCMEAGWGVRPGRSCASR
jgi:hypothetical protein